MGTLQELLGLVVDGEEDAAAEVERAGIVVPRPPQQPRLPQEPFVDHRQPWRVFSGTGQPTPPRQDLRSVPTPDRPSLIRRCAQRGEERGGSARLDGTFRIRERGSLRGTYLVCAADPTFRRGSLGPSLSRGSCAARIVCRADHIRQRVRPTEVRELPLQHDAADALLQAEGEGRRRGAHLPAGALGARGRSPSTPVPGTRPGEPSAGRIVGSLDTSRSASPKRKVQRRRSSRSMRSAPSTLPPPCAVGAVS